MNFIRNIFQFFIFAKLSWPQLDILSALDVDAMPYIRGNKKADLLLQLRKKIAIHVYFAFRFTQKVAGSHMALTCLFITQ